MSVYNMLIIVTTLLIVYINYKWLKVRQLSLKLAWIAHVPGLPFIGNVFQFGQSTDIIPNISNMMDKYGNIIVANIACQLNIVTSDYDFCEFILSSNDVLKKSSDYFFLQKWLSTGLLLSDGMKWKKRRRMLTPAFHFSVLEQFVELFESNGQVLITNLNQRINEDIDIYKYVSLLTLDVICETAMGVHIGAQNNEDSQYVRNVQEECRIIIARTFSSYKRLDLLYPLSLDYFIEKKAVKHLHSVTNSVIDARKAELSKKSTQDGEHTNEDEFGRKRKMAFLDILLQSTIDGKPLSREDIREEVDTFMFEGHDTTSSALTFALYLLGENQNIQEAALEEQRSIFSDDILRSLTYRDLQHMKYLECIIKESLRLYPAVPFYARYADKDVVYKGNVIPKGVNITIFAYRMHRDPENFPEPEKFDPNRFADGNNSNRPFAYVPFSAGPRNCIGQKFAMLEMKSILSKILRNFHILPCPDHEIILIHDVILKSKNGVKIKLKKRC